LLQTALRACDVSFAWPKRIFFIVHNRSPRRNVYSGLAVSVSIGYPVIFPSDNEEVVANLRHVAVGDKEQRTSDNQAPAMRPSSKFLLIWAPVRIRHGYTIELFIHHNLEGSAFH